MGSVVDEMPVSSSRQNYVEPHFTRGDRRFPFASSHFGKVAAPARYSQRFLSNVLHFQQFCFCMFAVHLSSRTPFFLNKRRISSWLLLLLLLVPLTADAAVFSYGSSTTYTSGSSSYPAVAKIDSTHVIAVFRSSSATGLAEIGTIDGTAITFGTTYQFAASAASAEVQMLDSTHAFITYTTGTTGYGVVATISGTSITYGTPVSYGTELQTGGKNGVIAVLDSTHVVIEYTTSEAGFEEFDPETIETKVVAGTISGTSITFGSSSTVTSGNSGTYVSIGALDATHAVMTYTTNTGVGYVIAMSVSGTSISLGSAVQYSANASDGTIAVLDSTHGIITYRRYSVDDLAYSVVATVAGTTVSLGSAAAVTAGVTYYTNTVALSSTTALLFYRDQSDSGIGKARLLTVSGGSVSSDSASVFLNSTISQVMNGAALDSSSAIILSATGNIAIVATTDTTAPSAVTSLSASVSGGRVTLSWTNPGDSDFTSTTIRRSSTAFPSSYTSDTAVASAVTGTSTTDTPTTSGTYYYSVFARDLRGNYSTSATVSVSVTVADSGGGGGASWLFELRRQNGLDAQGNSISSFSSSVSSSASSASNPIIDTPAHPAAGMSSSASQHSSSSSLAIQSPLQIRTCERVMKWFRGNGSVLGRLNARLMKHFGFICVQ